MDTPLTTDLLNLMPVGRRRYGSVCFTADQMRALKALYGYDDAVDEAAQRAATKAAQANYEVRHAEWVKSLPHEGSKAWVRRPEEPQPPKSPMAGLKFLREGSERNLFRHVEVDGLRVMAFLAPFLEPDEDPVVAVAKLAQAAGWDVQPWWDDAEDDEDARGGEDGR